MDNIYRENILDHYKNPRNFGVMKNADVATEENNPLCGDRIVMQLKFDTAGSKEKRIAEIKFSGEGCAVSMASASMLTEEVLGKPVSFVKKLTTKNILNILGITLSPTRLKCALLPLEVLQKTVELKVRK